MTSGGPLPPLDGPGGGVTERRHAFGVAAADGAVEPRGGERFALSGDGRFLFSCGYYDRSVRCSATADGRTAQVLRAHADVVSCLSLADGGAYLVTGSRDTSLMVWRVAAAGGGGRGGGGGAGGAPSICERPLHILHGHDDEVVCVAASSELNTIVSGSRDGTAIVYTLRSGQYMRSLRQPAGLGVDAVALSSAGAVVLYARADNSLHVFTINHRHGQPPLASTSTGERLSTLRFSATGDVLFTAGDGGSVLVRSAADLSVLNELRARSAASPAGPGPLCCLVMGPTGEHVLAGTERGTILVWGVTASVGARGGGGGDAPPAHPLLSSLDRQLLGFGL